MYKICVFAGTAEGREIVEFLCGQVPQKQISVMACVATPYGRDLLPPAENLTVSSRRMGSEEMKALMDASGFDLVIDATHPYAASATENIAQACAAARTEYVRLVRESGTVPEDAVIVSDAEGAAAFLQDAQGNVLLTTGSGDLLPYARLPDFAERFYARVLPMERSIELCREAGLPASHILAMQGPFSVQLNTALLHSVSARYLVTKEGGSSGGFEEKALAAREAGAVLVVIGRPPQKSGLSVREMAGLLCRRFGCICRPRVDVIGIGPGGASVMTEEARNAIREADCIIGAHRMAAASARPGQTVFCAFAPDVISAYIQDHPEIRRFAVVFSGDTGFFSGAKKLLPLLGTCDVRVMPGVSSLSCLCARLGVSYEDVFPVSLHGRDYDLIPDVRTHRRVFVLVGGEDGAARLCRTLTEAGMGEARVSVGERLSYPEERITVGTAAELAERSFDPLSAVLIEHSVPSAVVTHGLPDERFLRGKTERPIPMTKSEVRAVCLSKLELTEDAVCWDIGAGTGSVAIEMAIQARRGQVYAVEHMQEAVELIAENRERFGVRNLTVVSGWAPAVCRDLPAPTHAFIGGSAGKMKEILDLLVQKNPNVRITASAVTLESIAELTECMRLFPFTRTEIVSLSAARGRVTGKYHMMIGQNPVYIFTMQREADS